MVRSAGYSPMSLVVSVVAVSVVIAGTIRSADPPPSSDWWSLRPLSLVVVPGVHDQRFASHPVDRFIRAQSVSRGLSHAPEADRRTLIRRLYFDLLGIPPTPEQVEEFVQNASPDAHERLIDRLLASPQYGERAARHWLDVAHYADSHGQDQDRPRPHAWPYRDYVIESFNRDKPYGQFVREQIAGDVMYPADPQAIIAGGFLAAGPWDESSLRDIREDSKDREIARYLDRDDIVTSVFSTFAGLTVGCARCHDHKFDPISQAEYYGLQAIFSGIDKAERRYDRDPIVARQRAELNSEKDALVRRKGPAESVAAVVLNPRRRQAVADWLRTIADRRSTWQPVTAADVSAKHGSLLKPQADGSLLAHGPRPDRDTYVVKFTPGRGRWTGLRLEVLTDPTLPHQGPGRQDNGNLHLSEVRVSVRPAEKPERAVAIRTAVADFDQVGWDIRKSIDAVPTTAWGIYPAVGKSHEAVFVFADPVETHGTEPLIVELDQVHGQGHLIGRFRLSLTASARLVPSAVAPLPGPIRGILDIPADRRTPAQSAELLRLTALQTVDDELASLPTQDRVYAGTPEFASDGSFKPAGGPRTVRLLSRGEVDRPEGIAEPRIVSAIQSRGVRFKVEDPSQEGSRREALARWLSDPANPLPWRVMANRIWQHHFGRGIVDTPNDLGRMGGAPSHPELLEFLAGELSRHQSVKQLHRLILTSAVYRQSTRFDPHADSLDADNRLLTRMNRRRLDAESVRDAMWSVSGQLRLSMGGPPVMQFTALPGVHVTPLADYEKFDLNRPEAGRRSIYRFVLRTRADPVFQALDCPDGSASMPVRPEGVGPLQALTLWNNKLTLHLAEQTAKRIDGMHGDVPSRVREGTRLILGRDPTAAESADGEAFVRRFGTANWCRVMFNSAEFLFVE